MFMLTSSSSRGTSQPTPNIRSASIKLLQTTFDHISWTHSYQMSKLRTKYSNILSYVQATTFSSSWTSRLCGNGGPRTGFEENTRPAIFIVTINLYLMFTRSIATSKTTSTHTFSLIIGLCYTASCFIFSRIATCNSKVSFATTWTLFVKKLHT